MCEEVAAITIANGWETSLLLSSAPALCQASLAVSYQSSTRRLASSSLSREACWSEDSLGLVSQCGSSFDAEACCLEQVHGGAQSEEEQEEDVPFGAPAPPDQPFEAAGSAVGETYATVCWGLLPGAPTPEEFEVECRQSQGRWSTASIAECAIEKDEQGASLWVAVFDELEPRRDYQVRVRAKNDAGWGKWSATSEAIRTLALDDPASPRLSHSSSDFGERDITPQSSREEEQFVSAQSAAPVLSRFTQELGGFASKAAKLKEDATGVALKVKGDLTVHVSAALEEYQREAEFDETIVVPIDVLAQSQDLLLRVETPVDLHSREHWAQLRRIWLAANFADGEEVPPAPNQTDALSSTDAVAAASASSWTRLGFQNEDPSTDFRGGGLLALEAMLHFAENCPTQYRAMLSPPAQRKAAIGRALPKVRADGVSELDEPSDVLPVALTSINVTRMLLILLSLSRPSTLAVRGLGEVTTMSYDAQGEDVERQPFFELHNAAILAFDRCWQIRAARFSEFEAILALVQRSLRTLLLKQTDVAGDSVAASVSTEAWTEETTVPLPPSLGQSDPTADTGKSESTAVECSEAARTVRSEQLVSDTSDSTDSGDGPGESQVSQTGAKQLGGIEVDELQQWAKDASTWGLPDSILGTSKDLLKSALTTTRDRTVSLGEATLERTASVTSGVTAAGVLGSLREGAGDLLEKSRAGLDQVVKGQPVAVLSQTGNWRDCRVVERDELRGRVKVHYEGFDPMWDEWLEPADCEKRMRPRTVVPTVNPEVHSRAPTTSSALDAIVERDLARAHDTPAADRPVPAPDERQLSNVAVETMTVAQLRHFVTSAGLSHADCLEKSELQDRAREAALVTQEPQPEPELASLAAEEASAGLPQGWETAVSRTYGDIYYVNQNTGESQYERPTEPAPTEAPATPRSINAEMRDHDRQLAHDEQSEDHWEASKRALAAAEEAAELAIAREALEKRQFFAPYGIERRCVLT